MCLTDPILQHLLTRDAMLQHLRTRDTVLQHQNSDLRISLFG